MGDLSSSNPALLRLVDALAARMAKEYLAEKSSPDQQDTSQRANHAPLQLATKAA